MYSLPARPWLALRSEEAALAVVEEHLGRVGVGAPADAGHELAGAQSIPASRSMPSSRDLAARVGGEFDVLELDALDSDRRRASPATVLTSNSAGAGSA